MHGLLEVFFFVVASNLLPSASTYLLQSFLREEQAGYILGGAHRAAGAFLYSPGELDSHFSRTSSPAAAVLCIAAKIIIM